MKALEFVEAIRKVVLDKTAAGVISILRRPPGRRPAADITELSVWYNKLSDEDSILIERLLRLTVRHSILGVFEVLDGALKVDPSANAGDHFELRHVHGSVEDILSGPNGEPLHELL